MARNATRLTVAASPVTMFQARHPLVADRGTPWWQTMNNREHDDIRKRLGKVASPESVEAAMRLSELIREESRPDDDLGARLTLVMSSYLEGDENLEDIQMLSALAVNAWNTALLPPEERGPFTDRMIKAISSTGDPDGYVRSMTTGLIIMKDVLFPDDMRFIGDCDVRQEGGKYTIIASAGPEFMNGPGRS